MKWSLYSDGKFLEPLQFSNGKTQEDVVNEVLASIRKGDKIIFIRGICGTGKSAIALNLAKELGKTSVVVPIKNLQMQYKKDYERNKYVLKNNSEKLKISVITGRNNHKCRFLEDNQNAIPRIKKEIDSKLHDIFSGKRKEAKELIAQDVSADNYNIPCKIDIKEKNWNRIKKYLQQNKDVHYRDFLDIKDVKRVSVAGVCPYWCPVLPEKYELGGKSFVNAVKKKYTGLNNVKFNFYQRRQGCSFYEQFNSFVDSDVIVFNSMKYLLESALDRKPLTEVEIIDECDEFLDSFANQKSINLDRLQIALRNIFVGDEHAGRIIFEISEIVKQIKNNPRIKNAVFNSEIIPLKETGIFDLLRIYLKHPEFLEEIDEENYVFEIDEIAKTFEDFFDDTYVTVSKKDDNLIVSLVTTNLAKRFAEMVDKNKIIVLMSGTLHSENVLKNIFGLDNFKIIDAETEQQGRIEVFRTGLEMDCRYSKLNNGEVRGRYLKVLDRCVEVAKKPTLVQVQAFIDLPSEVEKKEFGIKNLISREKLRELQKRDKEGRAIQKFKGGEIEILFSTRSGRGIDFPGEQCNSIVFTKYPNPNIKDAFWKILERTNRQNYWEFYKDKARRELWQKVYRGVRFKDDHVFVLSPDTRVLESFEKN